MAESLLAPIVIVAQVLMALLAAGELALFLGTLRELFRPQQRFLALAAATLLCLCLHGYLAFFIVREALRQETPLPLSESIICLSLMVPAATLVMLLLGLRKASLPARGRSPFAIIALGCAGVLAMGLVSARILQPRLVARQPPPLPDSLIVASIAASDSHACGLAGSGMVACWGDGGEGQLGPEAFGNGRQAPVLVTGLPRASAVAVGAGYSCAIGDAKVWCWGRNRSGQLGSQFPEHALTPTPLSGIEDAYGISVQGGLLWVQRIGGQLVRFPPLQKLGGDPVDPGSVPSGTRQFVAGYQYWCALRDTGAVVCRINDSRALEDKTPTILDLKTPPLTALAALGSLLCGLREDGRVVCGEPAQISHIRSEKIRVCRLPYEARAAAQAYAAQAHAAQMHEEEEAPPQDQFLGDDCEQEVDLAEGAAAVPGLTELPHIVAGTALATVGDSLCVAVGTTEVRCGQHELRSTSLPMLSEQLAAVPTKTVRVYSNQMRSCVAPGPGPRQLYCWRGPVGAEEQAIVARMRQDVQLLP